MLEGVSRCVAQAGSALRSGRRGRRFKSSHTDQRAPILTILSKSSLQAINPLRKLRDACLLWVLCVMVW